MTKKSYKTSKKWTHGDNCHPLYRTGAVFHSNCLKIMKPFCILMHTTWKSKNKWTKISDLETNIFDLKMMVKSGLEFFILKFH